jgi:hypothetical protein
MGRKSREKREHKLRDARFRRHYLDPQPVKYPVQPLPSPGSNLSERALAKLGRHTFLSLWSYPNVMRREPQPNGGVISKEVADLVVVFGDEVIIFSDKDCGFPSSGKLDIDWARWYRRAVAPSAKQLWGAERWIRSHPDGLFIDAHCKVPFPIPLPESSRMRVHRVLIAHGASRPCIRALGGNGTLMLIPGLIGGSHCLPRDEGGVPFAVGRVDASQPFIHILDDASLDLLMSTLDTVADFVTYLRKKETLFESGRLSMATGEEALLGWYLASMEGKEHEFVVPADQQSTFSVDESWWTRPLHIRQRRIRDAANRVSYLWDENIELFAKHFRAGTSDHLEGGMQTPADFERCLRFFAREDRTRRRLLAKFLVEMNETTPPDMRRLRVVQPSTEGDPYWVLLLVPFSHDVEYRQYRDTRREYLGWCMQVTKLRFPEALDIVGFATETGRGSAGSEDAAYYDARSWVEEDRKQAMWLQQKLSILVTDRRLDRAESEYRPRPVIPPGARTYRTSGRS